MLTRSVKKESGSKTESYELNSHPLGTLFKFQSGCTQETNQSLVKVPLHGRCSRDALRCQHTLVHCLSAGWDACQQSLPPQPGIYYPQQFPNSSIAGLGVKHQSASVFITFANSKISPSLSASRKSAAMMQSSIFFFKLPFGIQMPSFSYCCLFLTETHRGQ